MCEKIDEETLSGGAERCVFGNRTWRIVGSAEELFSNLSIFFGKSRAGPSQFKKIERGEEENI
jgi:hypothetical protein